MPPHLAAIMHADFLSRRNIAIRFGCRFAADSHRGRPYGEANYRRDMRRATVQDPGPAEQDFGIGEEVMAVA